MGYRRKTKTEHTGDKGSSRKGGYWGKRVDAKKESKRLRRHRDKKVIKEQLGDK
jgi:hypothetical protein